LGPLALVLRHGLTQQPATGTTQLLTHSLIPPVGWGGKWENVKLVG